MTTTHARRAGVHRIRLGAACALASIMLLAGAVEQQALPSQAQIDSSLARGVAWIWPTSNGPQSPYREAAVLVESLVLRERHAERGGRTQPLPITPGVRLIPVLHVEAADDAPAAITPAQRAAVLEAVRRHATLAAAGAGVLQLDFEAPARQREAYRTLVAEVRGALPAGVRLSVTALAHWCAQGDWLDRLPVEEVVPMLYRLGRHAEAWRHRFARGDPALAQRCRGPALGFATRDPPPPALLARTARPYWFDDAAWSNPSRPPRHLLP